MPPRHRVSKAAIALIKQFEGYRRTAAQLPDGRWTLGYGHTLTARAGAEVSEPDAEALLFYDLIAVAHAINEHVYAPLGRNQFDALCSFAFNLGAETFRASQVLRRLNAGETLQAASAMDMWRKAEFAGEQIVLDALVRRRAVEKALFLTPDDGRWTAAPSAVLRPRLDLDALELVPIQTPQVLHASFEGEKVRVGPPDAVYRLGEVEAGSAVRSAAEAVSARLEPIFAVPDEIEAPATTLAAAGASDTPSFAFPPTEGADAAALSIPEPPSRAAASDASPLLEITPVIPSRAAPSRRRQQGSVIWDLLLAILGLSFFGFAVFLGLSIQASSGSANSMLVAWPGGLAGVGFLSVAVYRLLRRVSRPGDRD
jgi:lysozyme